MSKFKRSSSGFGDWMSVQVKFKGEKVGCLPILEDGTVDDKNVTVVSRKNVPDNLFEGKHVIQLSEDKKNIKAFKPYTGQHPAKFIKFGSKEGEPPAPKAKHGEYGEYLVFYPIFEITDGAYKGCNVSYQVAYKFQEGENGLTEFAGTKGRFLEGLEEFLDTVIGQFDPPKWSDNLLPLFQKMALRANRTVGIVFKKGFVATLVELDRPAKKSKKTDDNDPPWTPDEE